MPEFLLITDSALRDQIAVGVSCAAIVLLVLTMAIQRQWLPRWTRWVLHVALCLTAVIAALGYFEFGSLRYGKYMNPHDVFHYYIGAKYSLEHEYTGLYRAALIADSETGGKYRNSTIRNLDNHAMEKVSDVLARRDEIKARFTPARWEAFKRDVVYFRNAMPNSKWSGHTLRDKGYNAAPVWNALARHIANTCPTDSVWAMRALTYIDLVFLAAMFGLIWAAFGWQVMLFALIFHATNYYMSFVHIKGGFMRLDWVAMLVGSVCLLRLGWYKTAAACLAYAAMARVFPLIFVFGLGVKALLNGCAWARDRMQGRADAVPLNRNYVQFFAALGLCAAGLFAWSAFDDGGLQLWQRFAQKIAIHNADISTTRAGFKYIFVHDEASKATYFADHHTLWRVIMAAVLLAVALAARKLRDEETLPLGFAAVFFMTAPTFYYYVMLIVPLFLFLPRLESPTRTFGAILVFGLSIFAYRYNLTVEHGYEFFYVLSWSLLLLSGYLVLLGLLPQPRALAVAALAQAEDAMPPVPMADQANATATAPFRWRPFVGGVLASVLVVATVAVFLNREPVPNANEDGEVVTLAMVGDIMFSRNVARSIRENNRNFTYPFQEVAPDLQQADILFGNLECPVSGRGEKIDKRYVFNAPPESIEGLTFAGFDVISLANNHTLDYGIVALEDTEALLAKAKVPAIGLTNADTPQPPLILEKNGLKIGFLAYCDPVPAYSYAREFYAFERRPAAGNRENLARDIAALRPQVDLLVVSMHWGIEYQQPNEHQVALGRYIIDQGADLVAGHHPHIQQEPEVYKDRLIIHSMGNFVFDQHSRPATRESRLYKVILDRRGIVRAEYLPLEIANKDWQPRRTAVPIVPVYAREAS
jgi:poly-gamma-glutamate capsule biosynthesis protein CapA/YwtB (metallophosphatase superfamily)